MGWLRRLFEKPRPAPARTPGPGAVVTRTLGDGRESTVPVTLPVVETAEQPRPGRRAGASVAVDLGTSASAVATAVHADGSPCYVHFGTLGELDARLDDRIPLIGSDLVGPLTLPDTSDVWYVLGRTGRDWMIWLREHGPNADLPVRYYASVKRMLDVSDRLHTVRYSLGGVFRELLLLAFCPARSGTVRARYLMEQGAHDWTQAVAAGDLEAYAAEKQLGFPPAVTRHLADAVRRAGLELYVTVPNAFALGEIALMVSAARKAAADAIVAWGLRRSGLPSVHVLREAEAVACWHHHCLRVQPEGRAGGAPAPGDQAEAGREATASTSVRGTPEDYWFVFDMGAGTTDLALVAVRERGYRLVHRAGLPVGGDDVDLLFIRHLAHGPLRDYFSEAATGTRALSFDEVAELLRRLDQARRHGPYAGATGTDEPLWRPLQDAGFLQGIRQHHRLALKRLARECKVAWSQAMRHAGGPADPYLDDTFSLSGAEPRLDDYPEREALGRYLLQVPGYRFFVHLATRGCCQALADRTGRLSRPVSQVILSGRAARLPLIAEALARALEEAGYAEPGVTTYQWPLAGRYAGRPGDEVDGKLAVVRGAAWYGFQGWHQTLPRGVGNDIVMETFLTGAGEHTLVFRQGEPLDAEGSARRVIAVHVTDEQPDEPFRFRFYHQRLPETFLEDLGSRRPDLLEPLLHSTLCRRVLADGFRPRVSQRLGLMVDEERRRFLIYGPGPGGDLHRIETSTNPVPAARHPITGLPEDWLWEGEGTHEVSAGTLERYA